MSKIPDSTSGGHFYGGAGGIRYYGDNRKNSEARPMGKYIGWEALKLLALVLHAIYGQIYPKYSEHGQRKMIIPQKMTIITIAKALGYTYREMETLARELREVLGIKRVTAFQNLHAFAKKIKLREIQDIIEAVAIIALKNRTREIGVLIDSTGFQIMDATVIITIGFRERRASPSSMSLWTRRRGS